MGKLTSVAVGVALCVSTAGCNRRVFEKVSPSCNVTVFSDIEVPVARPADILIVVDNSGSMAEEQEELARNFVNPLCPIDLNAPVPPQYQNPNAALYGPGGPLEQCGFIQLIAAFDNDFRVGVVTTDVSMLDGRFRTTDGWGHHPQRGCLQPDGAPGAGARKLIARADLLDDDVTNDDLAARFVSTLDQIQIYGSANERPLDAAALFLDESAVRAPGCEEDLSSFRRPDAQLVVLFLTDEEDCSNGYGASDFDDEIDRELELFSMSCDAGVPCPPDGSCIEGRCVASIASAAAVSSRCYSDVDALPDPSVFADRILASDARAKIAVIAGLLPSADNAPSGCIARGGEVVDTCFASGGSSGNTQDGGVCAARVALSSMPYQLDDEEKRAELARVAEGRACTLAADGSEASDCDVPCCVADPGTRVHALASSFVAADGRSNAYLDSICKESYRDTMLKIAAFIASVDIVKLAEPPADQDLVVVSVTRAEEPDPARVLQIGADECLSQSGFYYDPEQVALVFCGDARLRPGDQLAVRAPGEAEVESCGLPD